MTIDEFVTQFPKYKDDAGNLKTAFRLAGYSDLSFESEDVQAKMRVASELAKIDFDAATIECVFLANCPSKISDDEIKAHFGDESVKFIRELEKLSSLKPQSKTLHEADSFRKMIFALVNNIKVILVELIFKMDKMRNLKNESPEAQKNAAQETLEIWAPLANRLGISTIKTELEDLSLKYLNNEAYQQIKQIVSLKLKERTEYLEKAEEKIRKKAEEAGIEITISKRAKHFYSIYQKMKKRNKAADELLDLLAIRIICDTTENCYVLIGLVHSLWKPMEGRFKDYIAMPKANGYQSLHTTVICDGKPLEIQIRTKQMHSVAEHGIASHWLYKKGTNKDNVSLENLTIINHLAELKESNFDDSDFFNEIKEELLGDSIFVFTPNGDVKELPIGATAIDFAYSIHSKIGETICGAKANGAIIPLNKPLENTQIIEILTSPKAHPTENQLHSVKTSRARSKINAWLLNNAALDAQQEMTPRQTNLASIAASLNENGTAKNSKRADAPIKIRVGDTCNYLVTLAKCCKPRYGDDIIGYVSRGRGIVVHKRNCPNFENNPESKVRSINVEWDVSDKSQ